MKSKYFFKIKPKTNTRKVCNKKKKLLHSFILKKEFSKKMHVRTCIHCQNDNQTQSLLKK